MGAVSTTFMAGSNSSARASRSPLDRSRRWARFAWASAPKGVRHSSINSFPCRVKGSHFWRWDIFKDNAYQSAANAGVLNPQDLEKVKPFLSTIKPMKAAFDHDFVS